MERSSLKAIERKKKRVLRIRKKISGTATRPRLCITKTNRQLFVQIIDDERGETVVSMSTLSKEFNNSEKSTPNLDHAKQLGAIIAAKCSERGITSAVLDRRGNKYHGQIATLADAMRSAGVQI